MYLFLQCQPRPADAPLVLVYLARRGSLRWNHPRLRHPPLPGPPTSLLLLVLDSKSSLLPSEGREQSNKRPLKCRLPWGGETPCLGRDQQVPPASHLVSHHAANCPELQGEKCCPSSPGTKKTPSPPIYSKTSSGNCEVCNWEPEQDSTGGGDSLRKLHGTAATAPGVGCSWHVSPSLLHRITLEAGVATTKKI